MAEWNGYPLIDELITENPGDFEGLAEPEVVADSSEAPSQEGGGRNDAPQGPKNLPGQVEAEAEHNDGLRG